MILYSTSERVAAIDVDECYRYHTTVREKEKCSALHILHFPIRTESKNRHVTFRVTTTFDTCTYALSLLSANLKHLLASLEFFIENFVKLRHEQKWMKLPTSNSFCLKHEKLYYYIFLLKRNNCVRIEMRIFKMSDNHERYMHLKQTSYIGRNKYNDRFHKNHK